MSNLITGGKTKALFLFPFLLSLSLCSHHCTHTRALNTRQMHWVPSGQATMLMSSSIIFNGQFAAQPHCGSRTRG